MKINKKIVLRILIIAMALALIVSITSKSYAILGVVGAVGMGIIFVWLIQIGAVSIGVILQEIMNGLLQANGEGGFALKSIFFNESPITTASYFAKSGNTLGLKQVWESGDVMFSVSQRITDFYVILRNLSIAILLFVLLYIGIRMAISTVASDEAKYKKMLGNWAVSLALVFVLHFIMVITFYINNTLVNILSDFATVDGRDFTGGLAIEALVPLAGIGEAIIYFMVIGMEFTFLFMYIKRTIVLGFLIIIAPLITITYSIDKIGDNKSQALNTWLKEFIYNVIIQPFHCIIYIVLIQSVIEGMLTNTGNGAFAGTKGEGLGGFIVYLVILKFAKEAENIVKKIFNIRSDSMPGAASMGALALGVVSTIGGLGKAAKGAAGATKKMPNMKAQAGGQPTPPQPPQPQPPQPPQPQPPQPPQPQPPQPQPPQPQPPQPQPPQPQPPQPPQPPRPDPNATPNTRGQKLKDWIGNSIKKEGKNIGNAFTGTAKFIGGGDTPGETIKGFAKQSMKFAAAAGMTAMGLGMADEKAAIGAGLTTYAVTNKIDGAIQSYKNNEQLEENEDVYTEEYENYVDRYKNEVDSNASEEDIRAQLVEAMKAYDDGTIKYDSVNSLTRDFLDNKYSPLKESYKISGADKYEEMARAFTTQKASKEYLRKHPNG